MKIKCKRLVSTLTCCVGWLDPIVDGCFDRTKTEERRVGVRALKTEWPAMLHVAT